MLTRLKVSGFKNLIDVDVRFGPFTCITGANGVGTSNLLQAIAFLGALASSDLADAAQSIDATHLFFRSAAGQAQDMTFEADLLIPSEDYDARQRLLRYRLTLGRRSPLGGLAILHESLSSLAPEAHLHVLLGKAWQPAAADARESRTFIETREGVLTVYEEHRRKTKTRFYQAAAMLRTLVSGLGELDANSPFLTIARVRQELQSWRMFQFERSQLRLFDNTRMQPTREVQRGGANIATALDHLANDPKRAVEDVYAVVANRLAEINDVRALRMVHERGQDRCLMVIRRNGSDYPASELSEGALRFLAMTTLLLEHRQRLVCIEDPDQAIGVDALPALMRLILDMAVDPAWPVGSDNPFRQVIIVTHSPALVQHMPEDSLVLARACFRRWGAHAVRSVQCAALPDTWRTADATYPRISPGDLLPYIHPVSSDETKRRVIDHPSLVIVPDLGCAKDS